MINGLAAIVFVTFMFVVVVLGFQVLENNHRVQDGRVSDQETVTQAARLIVQSATQEHPLLAYEHALQAKLLLDGVLARHGGPTQAAQHLSMEFSRVTALKDQIRQQYETVQSALMYQLMTQDPRLDLRELNEDAGLVRKRRRHRHREKEREREREREGERHSSA